MPTVEAGGSEKYYLCCWVGCREWKCMVSVLYSNISKLSSLSWTYRETEYSQGGKSPRTSNLSPLLGTMLQKYAVELEILKISYLCGCFECAQQPELFFSWYLRHIFWRYVNKRLFVPSRILMTELGKYPLQDYIDEPVSLFRFLTGIYSVGLRCVPCPLYHRARPLRETGCGKLTTLGL